MRSKGLEVVWFRGGVEIEEETSWCNIQRWIDFSKLLSRCFK